jgi:hypothetical protein
MNARPPGRWHKLRAACGAGCVILAGLSLAGLTGWLLAWAFGQSFGRAAPLPRRVPTRQPPSRRLLPPPAPRRRSWLKTVSPGVFVLILGALLVAVAFAVIASPRHPEEAELANDVLLARQAQEQARLNSYGWVDEDAGVAHIPIERAMEMILEEGLPARAGGD